MLQLKPSTTDPISGGSMRLSFFAGRRGFIGKRLAASGREMADSAKRRVDHGLLAVP
jgi:hypothetical protein